MNAARNLPEARTTVTGAASPQQRSGRSTDTAESNHIALGGVALVLDGGSPDA
jgi:hypothetical protein